jgi:hypothetical protein
MRIYAVGPEDHTEAGQWYTASLREVRQYFKARQRQGDYCYLWCYHVERPSRALLVRCLNHRQWAYDIVVLAEHEGHNTEETTDHE